MSASILTFLRDYLESLHVKNCLVSLPCGEELVFDGGLRGYLYSDPEYGKTLERLAAQCSEKTAYFLCDSYGCYYSLVHLPDGRLLIIGPYVYEKFDESAVYKLINRFQVPAGKWEEFSSYFYSLPVMNQTEHMVSLVMTFLSALYGGEDTYTVEFTESSFDEEMIHGTYAASKGDEKEELETMAVRYSLMADIRASVRNGDAQNAINLLTKFQSLVKGRRFSNPLSNSKYWLIVFNTSLRIASEEANVPPYYLNIISEKFSLRIDSLLNPYHQIRYMHDMIRQYCQLVQEHAQAKHPQTIQKLLILIDNDLCSDLSLNSLSSELNVNPSYLSHLFKKEMGKTLTEYVNETRINKALVYLNNTDLQVQAIAQKVGIYDLSYFTKLFRRQMGMSPTEYRKMIHLPY